MELTPVSRIFLALALVLVVCRVFSVVGGRFSQPIVVAEMVAGIALGPSLLGWLAPAAEQGLTSPEVRPVLSLLGQLGVCLYMFLVGLDFSGTFRRGLVLRSVTVSVTGIVLPLVLGFGTALLVGVQAPVSAVFIGLVLAITALPVLARIIEERGLTGSKVASIALAAGVVDDVLAWILLAVLLAYSAQTGHGLAATLIGLGGFLIALYLVVRPLLARLFARYPERQSLALSVAAALVFLSAAVTDLLGLHVVIGAFALGLAFPPSWAGELITSATKRFTVVLLLPFYFVYTGLNVDLSVLTNPSQLAVTAIFLGIALVAKLVAGAVVTRLMGERWLDALRIGVLMNVRGLMQLVALDIGLHSGLISRGTYSQLVVVAVVTTLMTTPLLSLLDAVGRRRTASHQHPSSRTIMSP